MHPNRAESRTVQNQRFTIGCLYPESFSRHQNWAEPCFMQTQCLVEVPSKASFQVSVCFLHPMIREVELIEPGSFSGAGDLPVVPGLTLKKAGHEAVERRVDVPWCRLDPRRPVRQEIRFQFPQTETLQPIVRQDMLVGLIRRRQEAVKGKIEISADPAGPGLVKVSARVSNYTWVPPINPENPDPVLMQTLASAHMVLHARGGEFISLVAPPPQHQHAIRLCRNIGAWPILVGDERLRQRDTMLSSPVMLPDYPRLAPEDPVQAFARPAEIPVCAAAACTDRQKRQARYLPPSGTVSPAARRCCVQGHSGRRHFGRR